MLFGKYCLLERVSVGGMAEIFRAKPFDGPESPKHLALKRILPHLAEDDEFIQMFIDEADLTVQLRHPNVVRTYERGWFHRSPYILMEFISGQDLLEMQRRVRDHNQTIGVATCCYIGREIAAGIDYVHRQTDEDGNSLGVIHRDLSPQNVLISYGGDVKIIDFGIAKGAFQETRTQVGVLKGKFGYMSPEQTRGETIDHRSDLFTIGTLLWEMLTNRRLFRGDTEFDTLELVRHPEVVPPSAHNDHVPAELDRIVMRALADDRTKRFQSGATLVEALEEFLGSFRPDYGAEDLSGSVSELFEDQLEAEQQKRQCFESIRSPEDVRRVGPPDDSSDTQSAAAQDRSVWAVEITPEDGVNAAEFGAEHTVIAAGGFDADQFADETAEEVIDLGVDDLLDVSDADTAGRWDDEYANTNPDIALRSGQMLERENHREVPNPSEVRRKRRLQDLAAAAAVLLVVLAAGVVSYMGVDGDHASAAAGGQMDSPATMEVSVSPPVEVLVRVDGTDRGYDSSVTLSHLRPGLHDVVIRHPRFEPVRRTVRLRSGESKRLNITLRAREHDSW